MRKLIEYVSPERAGLLWDTPEELQEQISGWYFWLGDDLHDFNGPFPTAGAASREADAEMRAERNRQAAVELADGV